MSNHDPQNDRAPLGHVGGLPVFATTILVAVHVVAMIACAVMTAAGAWPEVLEFSQRAVLRGQAWRLATYALLDMPSIWFLFSMFWLFWFGREVEQFLGRRSLLRLYILLIVLPPVVLLALPGSRLTGAGAAQFSVFIAFATLYPRALIWGIAQARWLSLILLALYALQGLAWRDWNFLVSLAASALIAFAFVRHEQGRWAIKLPKRKPKLRVIEGGAKPPTTGVNVDAILDKIGKTGMQSLTKQEREQLDRARESLLQK